MNPSPPISAAPANFYVTGGTLRPDAPSYVERQADRDLIECLLKGSFCYVLTSRQMGKSSLMVRSVRRLRQNGAAVAVLDLTAIGQNLTVEQWYDGLMARLGQQLGLEDEILEFWRSHEEWGPLQRWTTALEKVVLDRFPGQVIIFVDEIDIVRSLSFSTDEFFAAIRECYNRRSSDPRFNRLTFGLLGVAAPTDLIRDTRLTPFNIGHRIELNDFTEEEAAPLAEGLRGIEINTGGRVLASDLLRRVLYWTNGHPYLTQRLCQAVAADISIRSPAGVDRLCASLFLAPRAREQDDNLLFVRERLLRTELEIPSLLDLYRKVHRGKAVADDEANPMVSVLRLSGIVRAKGGRLHNRNRIYYQVFDEDWIRSNMPGAEVRRQKGAFRRGLLRGIAAAIILGFIISKIISISMEKRDQQQRLQLVKNLGSVYDSVEAYEDKFEARVEEKYQSQTFTPYHLTGEVTLSRPDRINFHLRDVTGPIAGDYQIISDGKRLWYNFPTLNQSIPADAPPSLSRIFGPNPILKGSPERFCNLLYRIILSDKPSRHLERCARNRHLANDENIEGTPCYRLEWDHDAADFLGGLRPSRGRPASPATIPVTAWIRKKDGLIIRWQAILPKELRTFWMAEKNPLSPREIVITVIHRQIQTFAKGESLQITFSPPPNLLEPVINAPLPPDLPAFDHLFRGHERPKGLIPSRPRYALPGLIDLSSFYNAALGETWHPGSPDNNLASLPTGILNMDGVPFDVRGLIQLSGRGLEEAGGRFPLQVTNIPVNQKCQRLHFLQAAGWKSNDGTLIGRYIVHYDTGEKREIPIIYGQHLRDWNLRSDSNKRISEGKEVWNAINPGRIEVRLFKSTWENPLPDKTITSLDFISTGEASAPFLVAITADDGGG